MENATTIDFVSADFKSAMSRAASSVSIVTTEGPDGRCGLTVSSMVSVSAEPPMLLVCVNSSAVAHDPIRNNGRFMINVLAEHQRHIADSFAGRGARPYHYEPAIWDLEDFNMPRLRSAAAFFECSLVETVSAGSHSIFIGRVVQAGSWNLMPLIYGNRSYGAQRRL